MASCALDLSSTLPDDRTSVERDLCKNYVTNIVHNSSQEQGNVFSAEIMKSNQSESEGSGHLYKDFDMFAGLPMQGN